MVARTAPHPNSSHASWSWVAVSKVLGYAWNIARVDDERISVTGN
jgi:hypothetical protein